MRKLFFSPIFFLGLIIRFLLIFFVLPHAPSVLQIPFLDTTSSILALDPWQCWLNSGGEITAFPYGYAMWLIFLPFTLLFKFLSLPLWYAYAFTILGADILLLVFLGGVLEQYIKQRAWLLLISYWLSPIVIVASYLFGYNDLLPIMLLVAALLAMKNERFLYAGALIITAVSAKIAMLMALPFLLMYLWRHRSLHLPLFFWGMAAGSVGLIVPFIFSDAGFRMLFFNPEMQKIYALAFEIGNIRLYILPLAYLVLLYMVWRIKRFNFSLFLAVQGVSFMLVLLMTHALPGWFCWAIPFLVVYQFSSDRYAVIAVAVFSLLYLVDTFLGLPEYAGFFAGKRLLPVFFSFDYLSSLVHTILVAIGVVLTVRMWRETISRNHYFRQSIRPLLIGITGDSGAGKSTLSNALLNLFGIRSVTVLSGDDYHLWDRQMSTWKVLTHLNPMANNLEQYARDLISLIDRKNIMVRHYDHSTGHITHPVSIKSSDIIIASGLHTLYLPELRKLYDVSIYLDMDENLRRYLKIQRDVQVRGHSLESVLSSLDRREIDASHFIRPQKDYADIIFSVAPRNPDNLRNTHRPVSYQLTVTSHVNANKRELARILMSLANLCVNMTSSDIRGYASMIIDGDISSKDIELIAQKCCPHVADFLDSAPEWQSGVLGLMQLVTLFHLEESLLRRLVQ